eukprot:UN27427
MSLHRDNDRSAEKSPHVELGTVLEQGDGEDGTDETMPLMIMKPQNSDHSDQSSVYEPTLTKRSDELRSRSIKLNHAMHGASGSTLSINSIFQNRDKRSPRWMIEQQKSIMSRNHKSKLPSEVSIATDISAISDSYGPIQLNLPPLPQKQQVYENKAMKC